MGFVSPNLLRALLGLFVLFLGCKERGASSGLRVVAGDKVSREDHPAVVRLRISSHFLAHSPGAPSSLCTGFFISPTMVVTAAHCMNRIDEKLRQLNDLVPVRIVGSDGKLGEPADRLFIHPDFTTEHKKKPIHDMAVLKFSKERRSMFFKLEHLQAREEEPVDFYGFGKTIAAPKSGGKEIHYSGNQETDLYRGHNRLSDGHLPVFAVRGFLGSSALTAPGDSGGPLISRSSGKAFGVSHGLALGRSYTEEQASYFTDFRHPKNIDFLLDIKELAPFLKDWREQLLEREAWDFIILKNTDGAKQEVGKAHVKRKNSAKAQVTIVEQSGRQKSYQLERESEPHDSQARFIYKSHDFWNNYTFVSYSYPRGKPWSAQVTIRYLDYDTLFGGYEQVYNRTYRPKYFFY